MDDRTGAHARSRSPFHAGLAVALMAMLAVVACDSTGPAVGNGRVQIQLTDAPSDQIESAFVWISRVYVQGGDSEGEEGGGRVDLFNDPENPREYDLLELRDGVIADLTSPIFVEAGTYAQLRLVVDSATLRLVDGMTFGDGSSEATLRVPSGAQSGIKVDLLEPIESVEGSLTVVLVDFDVDQNFVFQGPEDAPTGVLFTPKLKQIEPADGS